MVVESKRRPLGVGGKAAVFDLNRKEVPALEESQVRADE
jgi:hypothetical protein